MTNNLFSMIPDGLANEHVSTLLRDKDIVIERIVSSGQTTPQGEWLSQDKTEWVVLLRGSAKLLFENEENVRYLQPGDYVHIPANCRHRVAWTDPSQKTIWLAVHYK